MSVAAAAAPPPPGGPPGGRAPLTTMQATVEAYIDTHVLTGSFGQQAPPSAEVVLGVLRALDRRLRIHAVRPATDHTFSSAYDSVELMGLIGGAICNHADTAATTFMQRFAEWAHSQNPEDEAIALAADQVYSLGYRVTRVAACVEELCFTLTEGEKLMGLNAAESPSVIKIRDALVGIAARRRLRRRGQLLQAPVMTADGQYNTRTYATVKHPDLPRQDYTIEDFCVYETSSERNPELNRELRGHVVGGDIKQVIEAIARQPFSQLPYVDAHPHAFACEDGLYIGFLHDDGLYGHPRYDNLWEALRGGEVHAATNFGPDETLRGHLGSAVQHDAKIAADIFLTHAQARALLPPGFTASKYLPHMGTAAMGFAGAGVPTAEWERIATPLTSYIMQCQWGCPLPTAASRDSYRRWLQSNAACDDLDKHYRDVSALVFALLGRLFFPVNAHSTASGHSPLDCRIDGWQAMMIFKGEARTGKSSLGQMVREYMPPQEVGSIANRAEDVFGLQSLYDKRVVMGLELRKDFTLDTGILQQMIAGEIVSIARKNEDPINDRNWSPSMLFAMNETPQSWDDAKGAMTRRLVPIEFPNKIPQLSQAPVRISGDVHTAVHRSVECTALLRKMYCAYILKVDRCGASDLVNEHPPGANLHPRDISQAAYDDYPLPKAVHVWIRANQRKMNPLVRFFADESEIKPVTLGEVTGALMEFGHLFPGVADMDAFAAQVYSTVAWSCVEKVMARAKEYTSSRTGGRADAVTLDLVREQLTGSTSSGLHCYDPSHDGDAPDQILAWSHGDGRDAPSLTYPAPHHTNLLTGALVLSCLRSARDANKHNSDALVMAVRVLLHRFSDGRSPDPEADTDSRADSAAEAGTEASRKRPRSAVDDVAMGGMPS